MKAVRYLTAACAALTLSCAVSAAELPIEVSVEGQTFTGVIYDTPLAEEIKAQLPFEVSMVGYLQREYYGTAPFTPEHESEGQYRFDDGDLTFCFENNSLAIFFNQSTRPQLGMAVVPVGRITSDLQPFFELPHRAVFRFSAAE